MNESSSGGGYRNPPVNTRFKTGQSGNPKGRPPGRKRGIPYESVLGQMVTIRERGGERRVTAAEAFLLQVAKQGLEGDGPAARAMLQMIEEARRKRIAAEMPSEIDKTVIKIVGFNANQALEILRMGRKVDRYRPSAKMKLEPWIVEAALARLDVPLSVEDQRKVFEATRTPKKVRWPAWWTVQ